jgi:predicted double-glycine peptidase
MIIRLLIVIVLLGCSAFAVHAFSKNETTSLSVLPGEKPILDVPTPTGIPEKKILNNDYHIFQSFNNCGPASLSMALSYFGIKKSQEELAESLRPYQVDGGDNDDKSVTLDEMAAKAEEFGLVAYHRPNGNLDMLEQFVAAGIPVITRTWLHADEDIGHYRVMKGYDTTAKTVLQDDTFLDKNLTYTYDEFNQIWDKFNYEYLVLVPKEKKQFAESILGKNVDKKYAWEQAKQNSIKAIDEDPENIYNHFNLSVAYYNLKDYKKSVEEYEKVEAQLPFRTLWYQLEPVLAYYELGNYDKVLSISDQILNNQNRAYSELYILRGKIFDKQGNPDAAKVEYENALYYNKHIKTPLANLQPAY